MFNSSCTSYRSMVFFGCLGVIHAASAQEEPGKVTEEVVVTGFRQSVLSALDKKRDAQNIVDAIAAEDIGKSADQNIAEALQRVTGIGIDRQDGEGTTITIRGVGPNLNNVSLDGINLTSSGDNQAIDFSQFSSDILASIEVIKTPSADHEEGSLGASIRLNGRKPLNSKRDVRSVELQYRNNTFADDLGNGADHKVSVSVSEKFFSDTLGVLLTAATEEQTLRSDSYSVGSYRPVSRANGVTNSETGEIITTFDLDGDGDQDTVRGHAPRQVRYQFTPVQRNRDTVSGVIQLRPTDSTDISINATYSSRFSSRDQNTILSNGLTNNLDASQVVWNPQTFTIVKNVFTADPDLGQSAGIIRMQRDISASTARNRILGAKIEHIEGDFTFTLRGGRSHSSNSVDFSLNGLFRIPRNGTSTLSNGFDCSEDNRRCSLVLTEGLIDDLSQFRFQNFTLRRGSNDDRAYSTNFDIDWDHSFGIITSLEAGFKWSQRDKQNRRTSNTFNQGAIGNSLREFTLADFSSGESTPSDWGQELGFARDDITDGWPLWDVNQAIEVVREMGDGPELNENLRGRRRIQLDVFATYLKANYELFDGLARGDFGLRYAATDVNSTGFSGITIQTGDFAASADNITFFGSEEASLAALGYPIANARQRATPPSFVTGTNSYSNLLPSFNLNYLFSEDVVLRFAASQTIARPRLDALSPRLTISEQIFQSVSTASIGAPGLKPFKSTNLDLSVEWYFKEGSLLGAALFNKDLSDFSERTSFQSFWRDPRPILYELNDQNRYVLRPAGEVDFPLTSENVLLPLENGPNQPGCMPNRANNVNNGVGPLGCDVVDVRFERNGKGGFVRGLELTMQHNLTHLSGPFKDVGFLANYTYSDSEQDEEIVQRADGSLQVFPLSPVEGTSEHTFNTTVFYETKKLLLRLAFNSRSDFLRTRTVIDGGAHWTEGSDSLDFSGSWTINKKLSLHAQAINLTDKVGRQYSTNVSDSVDDGETPLPPEPLDNSATTSRTVSLQNTGTTYRLSARYKF